MKRIKVVIVVLSNLLLFGCGLTGMYENNTEPYKVIFIKDDLFTIASKQSNLKKSTLLDIALVTGESKGFKFLTVMNNNNNLEVQNLIVKLSNNPLNKNSIAIY